MRPLALALGLIGLIGCAESAEPEPVADQATSGGLTIHLDAVSVERSEDLTFIRADARWENDTGGPLDGDTTCGGAAFDGVSVVVRDERGNEVGRQGYIEHQSPYAESIPYTLPEGTTQRELVFPFFEPLPDGSLEIRLEGGLIGNAAHREGYASEFRSPR